MTTLSVSVADRLCARGEAKREWTRKNAKLTMAGAILTAAAAIIVTLVIFEQRRDYNARYPGCWELLDGGDTSCEAKVSAAILRGY